MKRLAKTGALLAVVSALAVTAACSSKDSTSGTVAAPPAPPVAVAPSTPAPSPSDSGSAADTGSTGGTINQLPPVTADDLPAYTAIAKCLSANGVKTRRPAVGKPFDTAPMSDLFDKNPNKFNAVLEACPDYQEKIILGN